MAQAPDVEPRSLGFGIALGTTIPSGYRLNMPDDLGVHAQMTVVWSRSSRLALRGDVRAHMLSGAVAIPSCIPSVPCRGFAIHPDQVYSLTASAETRPLISLPGLFATIGGGGYHGRGPQSTNFGTTFGALGGVGLDLGRGGRGLKIEAQYEYMPNAFGSLTGMLTPSIAYRF